MSQLGARIARVEQLLAEKRRVIVLQLAKIAPGRSPVPQGWEELPDGRIVALVGGTVASRAAVMKELRAAARRTVEEANPRLAHEVPSEASNSTTEATPTAWRRA